jgi:hypothetical protein
MEINFWSWKISCQTHVSSLKVQKHFSLFLTYLFVCLELLLYSQKMQQLPPKKNKHSYFICLFVLFFFGYYFPP